MIDSKTLDELLDNSAVAPEVLPRTFEEWCEIHGEPDYFYETESTTSNELSIIVTDCTSPGEEVDTAGIIYEDKHDKKHIDYTQFTIVFSRLNPIVYNNGVFYSTHGTISEEKIKQDIHFSLINLGWKNRLDNAVKSLCESLKQHNFVEHLSTEDMIIPLANGDLHIGEDNWEFRWNEFAHCAYRLSVNYTPASKPTPLFDKWLTDVFTPEDIPVIQEIMGYCLVPITSAQEAFFLVGDAGVGKSGLGTILKNILGNAFESINTQDLVTKRFQIATVENKLVAYDDDLGSAALEETGVLKKLITADTPIPAERKHRDPFNFLPYCRVVASANFMLSSLYDDSDGFYRRLHPILVKQKDPKRKTINKFYEMILSQEKEQIFKWALVGLKRVIENGWKISWSQRSIDYMSNVKSQGTHFEDFLAEVCDVASESSVSCAELKSVYLRWCKENGIKDASDRRLFRWFSDNAEKKGIQYHRNLPRGEKRVRGYTGLKIKEIWQTVII